MGMDQQDLEKLREELKDINVVYVAEGERKQENYEFFKSIFRKCYMIENTSDNQEMEKIGYIPEVIILGSKVKGMDAEVVIKSYLTHKIVPEVMLLVSENQNVKDFLKLYAMGITNFLAEDFEQEDFISCTKKVIDNLEFKRDKVAQENLVINKRKTIKTPQEMNVIILEKSIPVSNVIKNLLIKNGAQEKNIYIYRTVDKLVSHVRTQTKHDAADIVVLGDDEGDNDVILLVKNIIASKKDTYVLTMSAETSRESIDRLISYGIKDVIMKPFDESVVNIKIDKALKLGEGQSLGLNRHLYNISEIVEEYKQYRFLNKLNAEQNKLIEDYIIFLRRKK